MRRTRLQTCIAAVAVTLIAGFVTPALVVAQQDPAAATTRVVELSSPEELLTAFGVVILDVEEPIQATSAVGLAVQKPRVRKRKATIAKAEGLLWKITVQLEPGDDAPGAKVMAVAMDKDGHAVSGLVEWLQPPDASAVPGEVACRPQHNIARLDALRMLNEKDLRDLVALRRRRKGVLEGLLKDISIPVLFKKLNASEEKLGITHPKPLSAETPLEELLERLGKIDALLKAQH